MSPDGRNEAALQEVSPDEEAREDEGNQLEKAPLVSETMRIRPKELVMKKLDSARERDWLGGKVGRVSKTDSIREISPVLNGRRMMEAIKLGLSALCGAAAGRKEKNRQKATLIRTSQSRVGYQERRGFREEQKGTPVKVHLAVYLTIHQVVPPGPTIRLIPHLHPQEAEG
jgi:hypothetical protein